MIISENPNPDQVEFDTLLTNSLTSLNGFAQTKPTEIAHLGGSKLEPFIKEVLGDLVENNFFLCGLTFRNLTYKYE